MSSRMVSERDERAIAVENASYSLGYKILGFALLIDVAYRAYRYDAASWDLLGILIGTGLIVTLYQTRHKILGRNWAKSAILITLLAAAVAVAVALIFARVRGL